MSSLERFVLLGDIHTEDALLERALRFASQHTLDAVLAVGDVVDGPGDFARCVELLQEHGVQCVRGNHERWLLAGHGDTLPDATPRELVSDEARAWMGSLPAQRFYDSPAGRVQLCHGLGRNDMAMLTPDDYGYGLEQNLDLLRLVRDGEQRYVLHGHTHRRMVRTVEGVTFVNAGTLYRGRNAGFVLVDLRKGEARFYDLEGVVREASVHAVPVA